MQRKSLNPAPGRTYNYNKRAHKIKFVLLSAIYFPLSGMTLTSASYAFEIPTNVEDLQIRFDNTVKYSAAFRVKSPESRLLADVNMDDGDRNFRKRGLISNRLDLFSEFDAVYRGFGVRISGAAWYDQKYNQHTKNNSPGTYNAASVSSNHFPDATRDLHGRKAEFLDTFVFGRKEIGDMLLTARLGKYTILYGESLFFGSNGIAAAQAPTDIVKLLSVPGTQFKELMRPVPQISGDLQIAHNLSIGGYYQFHWEKDRLPAVGSYFSGVDILDVGGEQFFAGPGLTLTRARDNKAKNSGQGGLQLRYSPDNQDIEYGFYAVRYHSKAPITLMDFASSQYQMVYPEGIRAYGASLTTNIGRVNVGLEASIRHNMPLVPQAGGIQAPGTYPVGKTFHAQGSWIALLHASPFWQGGTFLGEIAYHRIMHVDAYRNNLDSNASRSAAAMRLLFTPQYFQVMQGVDIGIPIGLGYGLTGNSGVLHPGFGVKHGGDFSIGINGDYKKQWRFSLTWTKFFGKSDGVLTPPNSASPAYSYKQNMKDRDFIAFSLQRTF